MQKLINIMTHRLVIVTISILIQIAILGLILVQFNEYYGRFQFIMLAVSAWALIWVVNAKSNPAYKIAWIIPILLFPIFGGLFYWIFGNSKLNKKETAKMKVIEDKQKSAVPENLDVIQEIRSKSLSALAQSTYIHRYAYAPPYRKTASDYFGLGELAYVKMIEDLKAAEKYIFLEYFIIEEGRMWNGILDILEEKASEGLDVRVVYDDIGCILTLPKGYHQLLKSKGIKTLIFNPFKPKVSSKFNNRNHRKILVVDGIVGYTGGMNIADEYINAFEKHGHWKDSVIRLEGEAVWSLTTMFLSMWDYLEDVEEEYKFFKPNIEFKDVEGYIQPFSDNPLDLEPVGVNIYLNLISKAERYIFIKSPYLIIGHEMYLALVSAAKSGIDVSIILPGVPDKTYVHATTRSYYRMLMEGGVKIYEYTPGFVHEKVFVVDDEYAVIGTVNMDYRSLYLHFECGVWLYQTQSVLSMKADFIELLKSCQMITMEDMNKVKWYRRLAWAILRLFSPLM